MEPRFKDIEITKGENGFRGRSKSQFSADYYNFSAGFVLFLIDEAWNRGCSFEDLADGFGPGAGTHGDWSAIRDSTPPAVREMFERALNHLFPRKELRR